MNFAIILLASVLSTSTIVESSDDYPKNTKVDAINYVFDLKLSDDSNIIHGNATIEIRFRGTGVTELRFDLIGIGADAGMGMTVERVAIGGTEVQFVHENDALVISLPSNQQSGSRLYVDVSYSGVPATGLIIANNKYGDRTFFSDNWPNKARNWLPTIDHPYDKAMCEFIVTAPSHYQVVSNGLKIEESDLSLGMRKTHWKQSVPIASWLFVVGVARFAVDYVDDYQGKSIESWVYYQDRDAGFYDYEYPTKDALDFYSNYVGPFAYEKLANIQSNSVGGGMEAASAILYGENSVTGERSERWRNVIIHEIAHQWFGNAVTEFDWDDVWLSEGFATYFTLLYIEHAYGRDAFVDGLKKSADRVRSFYEQNKDYVLVHNNLSDMGKVTTSQTYQKGSWTLHMLRGVVGDDAFWTGIQTYYREFFNSSAATSDFQRHMEEASGQDLSLFFYQWLNAPGHLKVKGGWSYDEGSQVLTVSLRQVQDDGSRIAMPIQIGIQSEAGQTIKTIHLSEFSQSFEIDVPTEPTSVVLDPNLWMLMDVEFVRQ